MKNFVSLLLVVAMSSLGFSQCYVPDQNGHGVWYTKATAASETGARRVTCQARLLNVGADQETCRIKVAELFSLCQECAAMIDERQVTWGSLAAWQTAKAGFIANLQWLQGIETTDSYWYELLKPMVVEGNDSYYAGKTKWLEAPFSPNFSDQQIANAYDSAWPDFNYGYTVHQTCLYEFGDLNTSLTTAITGANALKDLIDAW